MKNKNAKLEGELNILKEGLTKFLSSEQIATLTMEKKCIKKWSSEGIIKGLKLRFALGKKGYNFMRETGYPAPSYSTLNKRVSSVKFNFGVLNSIVDLHHKKVEHMSEIERDCALTVDEMEIAGDLDFDRSTKSFVGRVTLGDTSKTGNHLTVVVLRGLNTPWKQIIACHITGPTTNGNDMKNLIMEVITVATSVGLNIVSICSDMGSNNKALWASLGVCVSRSERTTCFAVENKEIDVLADAPHLLKNWKSAIQNSIIHIPEEVARENGLITNKVGGRFVTDLWNIEMQGTSRLRTLHHLSQEIVNPGHFSKMNVGYAMRYISTKTAAALETAVTQRKLPPEALTTAWFIRILRQWFDVINSRKRLSSVTARNITQKREFLEHFVDIIQHSDIGKGWKPLNTGTILTTISFLRIATKCFQNGYKFLLGSRLSQDALENIFSQVRKRGGMKPTALVARKVLRLICLTQYTSDIKNTNYCGDSDLHLVDYLNVDAGQYNSISHTHFCSQIFTF